MENVRAQYQKEIQSIRGQIERKHIVHQRQFETEFKVYKQLWQLLANATSTTLSLRPMLDYRAPDKTEEQVKEDKLQQMDKDLRAFVEYFIHNQPFVAQNIFLKCKEIRHLMYIEGVEYAHADRHNVEYWKRAGANAEHIGKMADDLCDAIRARIAEYDPSYTKVG